MRTTIWTLSLAALVALWAPGLAHAQDAEPEQVDDVNVFYDSLSPYGDWVQTEEYGLVWKPVGVATDWRPYTYGRWVWTDDHGWYWASYYEWGWAPFHYGRWAVYPAYGWVWIPGTVWAPAWVSWRHSDVYIGWYPLWPEFVVVSGVWYPYPAYVHHDHWVFVETQHFTSNDQRHHYVPAGRAEHAYAATTESHEYRGKGTETHLSGPPREQVEKASGAKIQSARLSDAPRPASVSGIRKGGGSIGVYRPQFTQKAQVFLPKATAAKLPESARPSVGTTAPYNPRLTPGRGGAMGGPSSYGQKARPRYDAPLGAPGQDGAQGYRKRPYGGAPAYDKGGTPRHYPQGGGGARPATVPGGVHRPTDPDGDGDGNALPPASRSRPKAKEKKTP